MEVLLGVSVWLRKNVKIMESFWYHGTVLVTPEVETGTEATKLTYKADIC